MSKFNINKSSVKNLGAFKILETYNHPFAQIIKLESSKGEIFFLKHFIYPKNYLINEYDISPAYKKDRLRVYLKFHSLIGRNRKLAKYLVKIVYFSFKDDLLLTKRNRNEVAFSDLIIKNIINKKQFTEIAKLTEYLIGSNLKINSQSENDKNKIILNLKLRLQFKKPLLYILKEQEVIDIISNLGKMNYISHGDLQPKNIVFSRGKMEIFDFEEGFLAPQGWDAGFLWGNIFYLSAKNKKTLRKHQKVFKNIIHKIIHKQLRSNIAKITGAIVMMRLKMFPLIKLNSKQSEMLTELAKDFIKLYKKNE